MASSFIIDGHLENDPAFLSAQANVQQALTSALASVDMISIPTHPVTLPTLPSFLTAEAREFTVLQSLGDTKAELANLAVNSDGSKKKLSDAQKKDLRKIGTFEVPSLVRPEQNHKWMVNRLLLKGTANILDSLQADTADSLTLLLVTVKNLLTAPFTLSLRSAWNLLKACIKLLCNGLVGVPTFVPRYSEGGGEFAAKVDNARRVFVRDELVRQSASAEVAAYNLEQARLIGVTERAKALIRSKGLLSEEERMNRETQNLSESISLRRLKIQNQVDAKANSQMDSIRHAVIKEFPPLTRPFVIDAEVSRRRDELHEELLIQVLETDAELERLSAGIGRVLHAQDVAARLLNAEQIRSQEKRASLVAEFTSMLKRKHTILSRIPQWLNANVAKLVNAAWVAEKENQSSFEAVIRQLGDMQRTPSAMAPAFGVMAMVLQLQNDFDRNVMPGLCAELKREKIHRYQVSLTKHILFPQNWQAVLVEDPQGGRGTFVPGKAVHYSTNSSTWFWRLRMWPRMFYCRTSNFFKFIIVDNLWFGGWGVQALCRSRPFRAEYEMDSHSGQVRATLRTTPTFLSSLRDRWATIATRRQEFENARDNGLLGKTFSRPLHIFFQYAIRGVIGSTLYVLTVLPLMVLNVVVSVLVGVTAPAGGLVLTGLDCFLSLVHFDYVLQERYLFFRQGIFAPAFALANFVVASLSIVLVVFVQFPLWMVYAASRYCLRHMWDAFVFRVLIVRARVPAINSFGAVRVHGPDMAENYFFQISTEVALFLLQIELERTIAEAQIAGERARVTRVLGQWQTFFREIAMPFGRIDASSNPSMKRMYNEAETRQRMLTSVLGDRTSQLSKARLPFDQGDQRYRVRQMQRDLDITVTRGGELLQAFYMDRLVPLWASQSSPPDYLMKKKQELWDAKNLFEGEFELLAVHLFKEIIGDGFVQSLEDTDAEFVIPIRSERLKDLLLNSTPAGSVAFEAYSPRIKSIVVKMNQKKEDAPFA